VQTEYSIPGNFTMSDNPYGFAEQTIYSHRMATLARTKLRPCGLLGEVKVVMGGEINLVVMVWHNLPDVSFYWPRMIAWAPISLYSTLGYAVGRIGNRMLVGLPLCRDRSYLDIMVNFTSKVLLVPEILKRLPAWIRPLLSYAVSTAGSYVAAGKAIGPLIHDYLAVRASGKGEPKTFLRWMMDVNSKEPDYSPPQWCEKIVAQMMILNFVSIQTTNMVSACPFHAYCTSIQIGTVSTNTL
jgi:hypothetical protein